MKKLFLSLLAVLLVSVMLCTGATFAAGELPETTVEVFNDLAITFTLEKTRVVGDGNYAVVTHTYADGRPDTQETISQTAWVEEDTAYKFTYGGYAAKEMTDTLTVTVYDAADSVIAQWTTTARDVIAAQMAEISNQSIRAVFEAALEYGAAAQTYFDYAADDPANKNLAAEDSCLDTVRGQLAGKRQDVSLLRGEDAGVIYGTSCILDHEMQMRVYFTDDSKQVLVNGKEVQLQQSGTEGYYHYTMPVAPKQIFDVVTISVMDHGTEVAAARDSVASYCARIYKQGGEKEKLLADAILTYGLAAKSAKYELVVVGATVQDKTANGVLDDAVVETVIFEGLLNGESLVLGEDYTASAVYASTESGDAAPVTVTVTLLETEKTKNYMLVNSIFETTGKVIEPVTDKFTLVFENTEKYLYRVGNKNVVELGSLFAASDDAKLGDVTVTVTKQEGTASGTYTANSDWTKGTIKFSDTGVVKVTIAGTYANPLSLYLEVMDGYNVTKTSEIKSSYNNVFLNDITDGTGNVNTSLSGNTTYGNGFTWDVSGYATINSIKYANVSLANARLDNVYIVGQVYPTLVEDSSASEYFPAVVRVTGNSEIVSSYISNCRTPVRVDANKLRIIDSTLAGGCHANMEIRSGNVVLENVTTVQTVETAKDGTEVMGFGILIYIGAAQDSVKLEINGLTQYNWIGKTTHSPYFRDNAETAFELYFEQCAASTGTYNGENYINTGILCLSSSVPQSAVIGVPDGYTSTDVNYLTNTGWVMSNDMTHAENEVLFSNGVPTAKEYVPKQGATRPVFSGVSLYGSEASLEFESGQTYLYNPPKLTATKHQQSFTAESLSVGGETYAVGEAIPFKEAGIYDIHYKVLDPYNYGPNGEALDPEEYDLVLTLTVSVLDASIKDPVFVFKDKNGTTYETTTTVVNGNTYVMPKFKSAVGSPTLNDVVGTSSGINFVVVDGYGEKTVVGDNFNRYYPLLSGVAITDYTEAGTNATGTTYTGTSNYKSQLIDTGKLIVPTGKTGYNRYAAAAGVNGAECGNEGWNGVAYDTDYGGLHLKASSVDSKKEQNGYERIVWVEYSFAAGNGKTYFYRIGYHIEDLNKSVDNCITPDTMVTLADGTQKRVDALDGTEQLLVWNLQTGALDAAPIMFVDKDAETTYEVIALHFSDGTTVDVISEHGFWDYDLNRYVYLDANAADYIGHSFAKQDGETLRKVQLTDVVLETRVTSAWSPVTAEHLCYFVNGMLSMPGGVGGLFNFFEVDPATMTYDYEAMERDIKTYGLFTYEELNAIAPLSEEMFNAAGGAYLKVSIGKGNLTVDELIYMIERYSTFFGG